MDELPESVVRIAEAVRHLLLGSSVDEDGPQGLVLALQGTGRFPDEVLAGGIVPNCWPRCEAMVGADPPRQSTPAWGARRGGNASRGPTDLEN
jgi:hypothetical protein